MFRATLRSPFIDLLRHSIGVAGLTLVQQAIAILRKYGTDAHIYLPGIGTISGLTAGNYLDSAGTTAAAVDNPVGLSLDALQTMTLGAEQAPALQSGLWSSVLVGWTVASGIATVDSSVGGATAFMNGNAVVNKSYLFIYTISAVSGTGICATIGGGSNTFRTTPGTYTDILVAGGTGGLGIKAGGTNTLATITAVSIREITGIQQAPALQSGLWGTVQIGWAVGSGVATVDSSAGGTTAILNGAAVTGKTYRCDYTISSVSGTGVCGFVGGASGTFRTAPGSYTDILVATGAGGFGLKAGGTNTLATITAVSILEIPGIHASQATTANKPILRQSAGKYSWQFDGVNDSLSLSAPLFQMSDDHAVIAGVSCISTGTTQLVVQPSGVLSSLRAGTLQITSTGFSQAIWYDGTNTNTCTASSGGFGVSKVLTARKTSTSGILRENGIQQGSAVTITAAGVSTGGSIGAFLSGSNLFQGSIYPIIAIKGTVSDADLLTLERFVGQLSGVSI